MGKLSKMLYMIDLLNTGNIYTIKELSTKLGISERMVRYYKDEISKNGINIQSFKGPNGGYFITQTHKNYTTINKYDIQILESAYKILKNSKFYYLDKYEELVNKIKNISNINEEKSKFITKININNNTEITSKILNSIKEKKEVKIIYTNIDGTDSKRIIHPLQLFQYKNKTYVTAYCELRKDIRHFELKRIKSII